MTITLLSLHSVINAPFYQKLQLSALMRYHDKDEMTAFAHQAKSSAHEAK